MAVEFVNESPDDCNLLDLRMCKDSVMKLKEINKELLNACKEIIEYIKNADYVEWEDGELHAKYVAMLEDVIAKADLKL